MEGNNLDQGDYVSFHLPFPRIKEDLAFALSKKQRSESTNALRTQNTQNQQDEWCFEEETIPVCILNTRHYVKTFLFC